jgi:hypothetical protein
MCESAFNDELALEARGGLYAQTKLTSCKVGIQDGIKTVYSQRATPKNGSGKKRGASPQPVGGQTMAYPHERSQGLYHIFYSLCKQ